jgi:TolB-like protein/DNA-binding winged helix-turn-helix (wHTH) protein
MSSQKFRFGDGYELDLAAYELRRDGRAVKLPRIPTEVLKLLLEQRGNLVTREEIIERIWGREVFVDTDNSINAAIRKIRQVLKDDAEEPRFIQTVTGHGYRFIAAVEVAEPGDRASSSSGIAVTPEMVAPAGPASVLKQPWFWLLCAGGVALVVLAAFVFRPQPAADGASQRPMLAVLPFENLTGDATQDYFSDGLTEEMITQLGRTDPSRLGVIARTSVMSYKGARKPLNEVGRELGVQYVLEGSVRRDGEKIRVTAQLIQLKDQTHLWAQEYDRELKDFLVIQSDISREIASEIGRALGGPQLRPAQAATMTPQRSKAYDFYLKGLYFWNKRTGDGFQQAIHYFQQATEEDPQYALAFALLADSYAVQGAYFSMPSGEFVAKAKAAATRAVRLDDRSAEAHTALALIVQNHEYDWETSEREFRRAIELDPNYATAHHWYAEHLMWMGRFDEALAESERARQLDPLSLVIAVDKGYILYCARRYDESIQQFRSVQDLDPRFPRADLLYWAYAQKGMFTETFAKFDSEPAVDAPWYWSMTAYLYGRGGRSEQAHRALQKLRDFDRARPLDPMVLVSAYLGTGDYDQVIGLMEKAYNQHSNELVAIKVDPMYDPLRKDPRFQDLLPRLGLDQ